MIQESLEFVVTNLNEYLMGILIPKPTTDLLVFSVVLDQKGEWLAKGYHGLILSVQNIQQEKKVEISSKRLNQILPLELNIYPMISSHFPSKLTGESYGLIGLVIRFFYENPVFSPEVYPDFPPGIRQMSWEMLNLDFKELSHLWNSIGAKYMPSVIYKVRLQIDPQYKMECKLPGILEKFAEINQPST
ncbi:MAG: DUF4255 domain-containing protein [Bacteroidia bacterium]|nr:DUF4255 domain-containing protein [Bacteroidia bacterium]